MGANSIRRACQRSAPRIPPALRRSGVSLSTHRIRTNQPVTTAIYRQDWSRWRPASGRLLRELLASLTSSQRTPLAGHCVGNALVCAAAFFTSVRRWRQLILPARRLIGSPCLVVTWQLIGRQQVASERIMSARNESVPDAAGVFASNQNAHHRPLTINQLNSRRSA